MAEQHDLRASVAEYSRTDTIRRDRVTGVGRVDTLLQFVNETKRHGGGCVPGTPGKGKNCRLCD